MTVIVPELSQKFLSPDWMDDAACKGVSLGVFFSDEPRSETDPANYRNVCTRCPVRNDCLDYALVFDMKGVWGGMTEYARNLKYPRRTRGMLRDDYFDS